MPGAFLYDNLVPQAASITVEPAAGVSPNAPASFLLDPQPRLRVRVFAGPPINVQILVNFGQLRFLDCVALISTTASVLTSVRVRLSLSDATGLAGDAWDTLFSGAQAGPETSGNVVVVREAGQALGQYLLVELTDVARDSLEVGLVVAGPLWRLTRAQSYGAREGRLIRDQRDVNPYTGAEFPVPSLFNPRFAAFAVQNMTRAEQIAQNRELERRIGAAGDALWIPELTLSRSEMNRRSIWGAVAQPGDDVAAERVNFPGFSKAWRVIERG